MNMYEKRLTTRLLKYWERLSSEGELPDFAKWNPASIDDLWKNCLVMIAEPSSNDENIFKYLYVGEKIEGTWGKNFRGKRASSKSKTAFRGSGITKRMNDVIESTHPVLDDGKFVSERNKLVKYRSCLLPFGNSKDGVVNIVIGLSWKEF